MRLEDGHKLVNVTKVAKEEEQDESDGEDVENVETETESDVTETAPDNEE